MAIMIGCPSCGKSVTREALYCSHCAYRMADKPAPIAATATAPPRWGRILLAVGGLLVLGIWMLTSASGPRREYLAFDQERQEWHQRCDVYVGKPTISPIAIDCAKDLEAMMAYAKRKGWR